MLVGFQEKMRKIGEGETKKKKGEVKRVLNRRPTRDSPAWTVQSRGWFVEGNEKFRCCKVELAVDVVAAAESGSI